MVKYKDNLKRFDCPITTNWVGLRIMMEAAEDGDYVFYDGARHEIEQCLQVITELKAENERLQKERDRYMYLFHKTLSMGLDAGAFQFTVEEGE